MVLVELSVVFLVMIATSFSLFYLVFKHNDPDVTGLVSKDVKYDKTTKKKKSKAMKGSFSATGVLASKWVQFGGGFYGLVAVLTYVVVEAKEVINLLSSEAGIMDALSNMGLGTLINFFIESLMNFIAAITWPVFWMGEGNAPFWQWILAAYAGYYLGQSLAKNNQQNTV